MKILKIVSVSTFVPFGIFFIQYEKREEEVHFKLEASQQPLEQLNPLPLFTK